MDQLLAKYTIKSKALVPYAVLFAVFIALGLFSYASFSSIGHQLHSISEKNLPVSKITANITVHQLEQAVQFERASRYAPEALQSDHAEELYLRSKKYFSTLAKQVDQEILDGQKLADDALADAKQGSQLAEELGFVKTQLATIKQEHIDYDNHVEEAFELYEKGAFLKAEKLVEKIEKEQDQLVLELEHLSAKLVEFTETATLEAVTEEEAAIRNLIYLTVFAAALIVFASVVIFRAVIRPIEAVKHAVEEISKGKDTVIPSLNAQDEVGDMARALQEISEVGKKAVRVETAMDGATACVMMADEDLNIVYMNDSLSEMMRIAEPDLKKELTNFDADNLMGQNIDGFHKNPSHQRNMLARLTSRYETTINIGPRTFDLIAIPLVNEADERIGFSVEWIDKTAELAVAGEIKDIIAAASKGDLESRIQLDGKDGFFLEVSEGINNLADVMKNVSTDLAENLKSLSEGDLTSRIDTEYEGIFKQLKDDYNRTSSKLAEIVGSIKNISLAVNENAGDMSEGSSGLANRTEQQASTLEETAASMEELTTTVKTNADNAKEASQAALDTRNVAERGSEVANDAGAAMEKINDSSTKITDIINVIDEIAFQTNLLALNAAVEAARAGDAGRGFAVVAQEVRTLAQRSAQSSKDIKALIDDSSQQVSDGVQLVKTAVTSLQDIYDAIDNVSDTVNQIASASSEQATSLDELNQAIMEMDSTTQQNASMAHQSKTVAQLMQEKSYELSDMVSFFNIDGQTGGEAYDHIPIAKTVHEVDEQNNDTALKKGNGKHKHYAASGGAVQENNDADWKEF